VEVIRWSHDRGEGLGVPVRTGLREEVTSITS